jgi:hypothetical protein
MRKLILASLLATSGIAAATQPVLAQTEAAKADAKASKDLKEMEKIFSNIFDNKDAGPIDPARLTLAKQTTAKIMPDGIYSKMMNDMMGKIMGAFLAQTGGMSDLEITLATGVEASEAGLDEAKRKAITDLLDPNHAKRAEAMKSSFGPMMDKMARTIEPPMREGLARAYARKFSVEQLTELNGFLSTPTGSFYASESFLLQADPEVMQAVFSALPTMLGDILDPAADFEKSMGEIPAAKTLADLSTKDKDAIAKLLGTTADKLNEFGAAETSDDETALAATAADETATDPFANESGTEPWWDRTNWDKADQKKIAELESKSSELSGQADIATAAYLDFETEVMLRLRERYLAKGWKPSDSSE